MPLDGGSDFRRRSIAEPSGIVVLSPPLLLGLARTIQFYSTFNQRVRAVKDIASFRSRENMAARRRAQDKSVADLALWSVDGLPLNWCSTIGCPHLHDSSRDESASFDLLEP
jgi:hypothetical protein